MADLNQRSFPQWIRLSILDRSAVLPETEDRQGPHFPRSIVVALRLKSPATPTVVSAALRRVDDKFPQFRLAYTLDYERYGWRRVADSQLDRHFESLVDVAASGGNLAERLSGLVATNNTPFFHPLRITLQENSIIFKISHALGDANFMFRLVVSILLAILVPEEFDALPNLPLNFGLPAWRLMTQSPGRLARIILECGSVFREWFGEWRVPRQPVSPSARDAQKLTPIVSGSPMKVVIKTVSPELLSIVKEIKRKVSTSTDEQVSLTTLLYVLFTKRLVELGLVGKEHWYTFPVDLHRYLRHPSRFVPGNMISELRIHVSEETTPDLAHECAEVQRQFDRRMAAFEPLAIIPMLWLMILPGNKFYNRIVRKDLLASNTIDPRSFYFTSLGNRSLRVKKYMESGVDMAYGLFGAAPIIGGLRICATFCILDGQGHLTLTYDPLLFSEEQIQELMAMFDQAWLEKQCLPT